MTADRVHKKWMGWVHPIRGEVLRLYRDREIWQAMRRALLDAGGDGIFLGHYALLYAEGQALGIRRLVRPGKDSISLGRLLAAIANRPDVPTKERYLASIGAGEDGNRRAFIEEQEAKYYDREWANNKGSLDVGRVRADIDTLDAAAIEVMKWVDRMVAHVDSRGFDGRVTWKDLDESLDLVGDTFKRYDKLVTGFHWDSFQTWMTDWQAPLRQGLSFETENRSS
jgi:hypothetical protein